MKWHRSKHLTYGSLICLSQHRFAPDSDLLWAVVADRDAKRLSAVGEFDVKFSNTNAADLSDIDALREGRFCVVASSAYFEAVVHTFKGLQRMPSDGLPFEDTILGKEASSQNLSPAYIRQMNGRLNVANLYRVSAADEDGGKTAPTLELQISDPLPAEQSLMDSSQRDALHHIDGWAHACLVLSPSPS